ncbi:MAG: hypothetical protein FWH39_05875 [Bacteroidales bacterium]|nr:hypothetical protein [Bacteroidales bacterium]
MRFLLLISLLSLCVSCEYFQSKQQNDTILAEAEGKTLYLSDLKNIFYAGITSEDSLELLKNHVYNWTHKCVMAAKAEQMLSKQQLNVTKEVDDYRMSLLAYRYELYYIQQELDTLISNEELLAYYEKDFPTQTASMSSNFAKVVYIKVKQRAGELNKLRTALLENRDRQFLDSLCLALNVQPDYRSNQWIDLDAIQKTLPFSKEQCSLALKNNVSMLEEKIGDFVYLLGLREIKKKIEYPPITQLEEQYYTTIINQRRMDLLKKIEKDVYNEALDNQRLKIYINE